MTIRGDQTPDEKAGQAEPGAARLPLRDLALLGDRRSAALVSAHGTVMWYSPRRFDAPTLLAPGCWTPSAAARGPWRGRGRPN